jgi:ribose/xylose/arabinose/galactoside ABC-type transport system permease subunit
MKPRKKLLILTFIFSLCVGNFIRISNHNSVRAVEFLSIFALGVVAAIFYREINEALKNR